MYWTHNEGKSIVAERFIKTLKQNIGHSTQNGSKCFRLGHTHLKIW